MRHGGVYIGNQAVPGMMCVRSVSRERGHLPPWWGATRESFLNKYDVWVVLVNICLECSELRVVSDSKGIP